MAIINPPFLGVNFVWVDEPESTIVEGRPFNVTYELTFDNNDPTEFFQWLVDEKFMPQYTTLVSMIFTLISLK